MSAYNAIEYALSFLRREDGNEDAVSTLQAILNQRGCEDIDPACESLTDLIDVVMHG